MILVTPFDDGEAPGFTSYGPFAPTARVEKDDKAKV
jgi:hypothetical protein